MTEDRKMRSGDHDYMYSDKVTCCKWFDRRSVLMLFSNIEGMSTISTVLPQQKGSASKIQVPCPDVIKMYNQDMGDVDLIDQRTVAYHLYCKSRVRFYLRIFSNLLEVVCANSFVVSNMLHSNDLTLLDFKTIIATYLIGRYTSRSRAPPDGKTGSKRKYQYQFEPNHLPLHLPEFQSSRKRCKNCYKEGFERKTFVKCTECRVFLCLVKERNCFMKHHSC